MNILYGQEAKSLNPIFISEIFLFKILELSKELFQELFANLKTKNEKKES